MMRIVLFILLMMPVLSYADDVNGRAYFKDGINLFRSGDYEEAIKSLKTAHERLPLIGDYSLLYISKAYAKTGNPEESNNAIKDLLARYPETPLKKSARALLISNTINADEDRALALLESYTRDYPSDTEMRFSFGQLLKKKNKEKAESIFNELYIEAGAMSKEAEREFDSSSISTPDIIRRAENLIKAARYKEAESALKVLLSGRRGGSYKKAILETLGTSLFKQKNYKEAGINYLEADNYYDAALSFFRASEHEAFNETLKKLISTGDTRAGRLLIMSAVAKRRKGDTEGALEMLTEVRKKYPSYAEQALWHTGWTYYLSADYKKALSIFDEMSDAYQNLKYLYWKAMTLEKTGEGAGHLYKEFKAKKELPTNPKNDFYSVLIELKAVKDCGFQRQSGLLVSEKKGVNNPSMALYGKPLTRHDLLAEAGLREDSVRELIHIARNITNQGDLVGIAYKLKEMNEYQRAISLTLSLPEDVRPPEILYPLAYWTAVSEASREFGIDPLLILSVIREESRFAPDAYSNAGAVGVMQIMPETASRLAQLLKVKINGNGYVYDVPINIRMGSYYLSGLQKEFGSVLYALAGYNAGEVKVRDWLRNSKYGSCEEFIEDMPYQETQDYVKRILSTYFRYKTIWVLRESETPESGTSSSGS